MLLSLAIVVALSAGRRLLIWLVVHRASDSRTHYYWRKGSSYVTVGLAVLLIGRIWFEGISSLATYLGLLSAGVAIALQSLVLNLAGWAFIVWRRPFEVGDRIEIGAYKGDVVDIGAFGFTLLELGNWVNAEQSSGRTVRVPNGQIFSEAVANYTRGFDFIWAELPVVVTFESDWQKAKQVLTQIVEEQTAEVVQDAEQQLRQANEFMMVQYSRLSPTVYTRVVDSGVDLTLRFICPPRSRRDVEQAIWEAILRRFDECGDIDFAYPTRRVFSNASEGKPDMRAVPVKPAPDDAGR